MCPDISKENIYIYTNDPMEVGRNVHSVGSTRTCMGLRYLPLSLKCL